jgi:hypothetical protein
MRSTEYYQIHNEMIEKQSRAHGVRLGTLVSGHKKDVVITNRLAKRPGQIAIYGWHRATGAPIQPLSTVHGAGYADYSHGIRLISETAIIDGKLRSMYDILQDSLLANVLSDEGAIRILPEVIVASRRERLTFEQDQTGLAPDDLPDTSGSMRRLSLWGQTEQ